MSDFATSARPYARAVFELARDAGALDAWRERLQTLASLAGMDAAHALFGMPGIDRHTLTEVLNDQRVPIMTDIASKTRESLTAWGIAVADVRINRT
ncbi:F0F1 ATP synthase subunit delta, partial [Algiphilus sp.]|uniref:F0F1 ATP synthase subunit delta n=1 Tax=Algiphilus sp. TaxID=1872431 RepID=UPI003C3BA018